MCPASCCLNLQQRDRKHSWTFAPTYHLLKLGYRCPSLSKVSKRLSVWFCSFCWDFIGVVEMLLLRKWLCWEQFLTVGTTLTHRSSPSYSPFHLSPALLSELVFLSHHTPAESRWSKTRCDQPNVIFMYHQTFLTYITPWFLSNNSGPHFSSFWGMLS